MSTLILKPMKIKLPSPNTGINSMLVRGFELDHCPFLFFRMLRPILFEPGKMVFNNCIKAVQNVVKFMNQQYDTQLEFVEITGRTYCPCFEYHLNFKAKDMTSGETAVRMFNEKLCKDSIQA